MSDENSRKIPLPVVLARVQAALTDGLGVRRRTIDELSTQIAECALLLVRTLKQGGAVLACGNGGSAASAQHLVGELVGRYLRDRRPLPGINLSGDAGVLTCIANDYGYEQVFARQVRALGRPGDLLIGFTTSGRSENVLAAFRAASEMNVQTLALTGANGLAEPVAAHILAVPSTVTARIQEEHDAILHAWCDVLDDCFAGSSEKSL